MKPTDQEILRFWNGETNHSNKRKVLDFGLRMFELGVAEFGEPQSELVLETMEDGAIMKSVTIKLVPGVFMVRRK